MDSKKIEIGNKKTKKLVAGVHTNMQMLRVALNKVCETLEIDKPDELKQLNTLFESKKE